MKAAYIGILTPGTTSRMRADTLKRILPAARWTRIDTDVPFLAAGRVARSLAFRYQRGPLVGKINDWIRRQAGARQFDLVWVDKGIYLRPDTLQWLRGNTDKLLHFTPDAMFHANRSRFFFAGMCCYDRLVTSKGFERQHYVRAVGSARTVLTTQGFDPGLHAATSLTRSEKGRHVVFIGLRESDREVCIRNLLDAGVKVRLGGRGWRRFVAAQRGNPDLVFLGDAVFGEDYVREYAGASVGLGLLSKRFPETHTTRTFEIPAMGTVLATERNAETETFFREDEVIFFEDYADLAQILGNRLDDADWLQTIARNGRKRVLSGGFDYESILRSVLHHAGISI